jgi:hypothetical protein
MVDLERQLREYGAELIESERPVEKAEVRRIARAEAVKGPVTSLDVFDRPETRTKRRAPWKVAVAAAAVALLLFAPFVLSPEEPEVADDTTPPAPTTVPSSLVPRDEQYRSTSHYDIGDVSWYEAPAWLPWVSIARIDGRYQARDQQGLWQSSDNGFAWAPSPSNAPLTSEIIGEGDGYAVFDSNDSTWLMVREAGGGDDGTMFRRVGDRWVEEPWTPIAPPSGVSLAAADQVGLYTPSPVNRFLNTTVAQLDGTMTTVPYRGTAQMVAMGGFAYAISLDGPSTDGVEIWRSSGGGDWETIAKPDLPMGEVLWTALTAGHDRLMLTVATILEGATSQAVWTTSDGEQWEALDVAAGVDAPAVPQPTEFGWLLTTPGSNDSGLWEWGRFRAWLSSDGLTWENVTVPGRNGGGGGPAYPLTYQAGLFLRHIGLFEISHAVIGRLDD